MMKLDGAISPENTLFVLLCFEGPDSELKLTANTQPALLVTSIAAWRVFESENSHRPIVALGHSLGEYTALVAAGALTLGEGLATVRLRGQAMQDAVPVGTGGMVAVLGVVDLLQGILRTRLSPHRWRAHDIADCEPSTSGAWPAETPLRGPAKGPSRRHRS